MKRKTSYQMLTYAKRTSQSTSQGISKVSSYSECA